MPHIKKSDTSQRSGTINFTRFNPYKKGIRLHLNALLEELDQNMCRSFANKAA
jgi:hypothetical protein